MLAGRARIGFSQARNGPGDRFGGGSERHFDGHQGLDSAPGLRMDSRICKGSGIAPASLRSNGPMELGDKAFYTKEEAAAYEQARNKELNRDRRDGGAVVDAGRGVQRGLVRPGLTVGRKLCERLA